MQPNAIDPYDVCPHCDRESPRRLTEHILRLMRENYRLQAEIDELVTVLGLAMRERGEDGA